MLTKIIVVLKTAVCIRSGTLIAYDSLVEAVQFNGVHLPVLVKEKYKTNSYCAISTMV